MMQTLPDGSHPANFLLFTVIMFVIIVGRYLLVAGLFQLVFYHWFREKWQHRHLGKKLITRKQFYKEVRWSTFTSLIFAVAGAITIVLWQKGFTKIYFDFAKFGWVYLPVSLLLSMFIHETYYYFLHRWMHRPAVFRLVHKAHHDSKTTSAWTAFSFHPLEGLLQAIILPLTIMILPMHIYVLLTQLVIMSLSSVVNHLEIELMPAKFLSTAPGKWIIGATHHSMHHKQYKYNFGLYFTFWDNWAKTESPAFKKLTQQPKPTPAAETA